MDFFTTNPNETTSNPIRFFSPDITNLPAWVTVVTTQVSITTYTDDACMYTR